MPHEVVAGGALVLGGLHGLHALHAALHICHHAALLHGAAGHSAALHVSACHSGATALGSSSSAGGSGGTISQYAAGLASKHALGTTALHGGLTTHGMTSTALAAQHPSSLIGLSAVAHGVPAAGHITIAGHTYNLALAGTHGAGAAASAHAPHAAHGLGNILSTVRGGWFRTIVQIVYTSHHTR